jgi:hypothetical protein
MVNIPSKKNNNETSDFFVLGGFSAIITNIIYPRWVYKETVRRKREK